MTIRMTQYDSDANAGVHINYTWWHKISLGDIITLGNKILLGNKISLGDKISLGGNILLGDKWTWVIN